MKRFLPLALVSLAAACSLSAQTLLHQWRFGENDPGATNGGTITVVQNLAGGTTVTPSGSAIYSNSTPGSGSSLAASFSPGSAYFVGTGDTTLLNTSSFFVEGWFYMTAMPTDSYVFFNGTGSSGFGFYVNGATMYYQTPGGAPAANVGSVDINSWNYFAFVYANGAVRVFVNGDSTPTFSQNHDFITPESGSVLQIGGSFAGALDEFRVVGFTGSIGDFSTSMLNYASVSAIPEPSTYAALAGLAALGAAFWRRRQAVARA